jgi:hypothetical protein
MGIDKGRIRRHTEARELRAAGSGLRGMVANV